ncbi:MAG: hypothetical protein ACJ8M1_14135 [Chthoniobacterales bacterium]
MNRFITSLIATLAFTVCGLTWVLAQSSASTARTASPSTLAPLEFLVGGVWHGELPARPDGSKMGIDLRSDWSPNHQSIRFDSAFISGGKPSPYTSGAYSWNPVGKQIVFAYTDAEGSLIEGAVSVENAALVHNFTISKANAEIEKARAIITPHGRNSYTNDIFVDKGGSFQKIASLQYDRVGAAEAR